MTVQSAGMADSTYNAQIEPYGDHEHVHESLSSGSFGLAGLTRSFERSLRAARKGARTIEDYVKASNKLAAWLAAQGMPTDPEHIAREHLEAFIVHELERGLASSTVAADYRRLQQLFRWLKEEGEITANPMANMSAPAVDTAPVPVVKPDDLKKLIAVCDGTDFYHRRDMAFVRLFFDAGVRLEEMELMKLTDIDWDAQEVRVRGKGGKERDCPFGAKTAQALDRYIRSRSRHRNAAMVWLWIGSKGRFTRSGLAGSLSRRAQEAGIGHIHPHQARHTNAHSWLLNDGGEGDLMELMGWSSRAMLDRYGKSARNERARNAHKRKALGDDF